MFKYKSRIGDRVLAVGIVPAPVDEFLWGHPLEKLAESHFLLDDPVAVERWISALETATPEQIEAGRILFAFTVKNIKDGLHDRYIDLVVDASSGRGQKRNLIWELEPDADPILVAQRMFDVGLDDARKLLKGLIRSPRSKQKAVDLQKALAFLYEGREFFFNLRTARRSDEASRFAKNNENAFHELRQDVAAFVEALPSSDQDRLSKHILPFHETEKIVLADLTELGSTAPDRLSSKDLETLSILAGRYDTLWTVTGNPSLRDEFVEKGWLTPLNVEQAEEIRLQFLRILRIHLDTFGRKGFVGTLRELSAVEHYLADTTTDRSTSDLETKYSRQYASFVRDEKDLASLVDAKIAGVPEERRQLISRAAAYRRMASAVDDMLESVDRVARPSIDRSRTLSFEQRGEDWIGTFDKGDEVLAIYADPMTDEPNVVFAVLLDRSEIAGGLPELAVLKSGAMAGGDARRYGTNYANVQEAFADLPSDRDASFFFSERIRVSIPPSTSAEAPAPGL